MMRTFGRMRKDRVDVGFCRTRLGTVNMVNFYLVVNASIGICAIRRGGATNCDKGFCCASQAACYCVDAN